jgi:hypothetical protein
MARGGGGHHQSGRPAGELGVVDDSPLPDVPMPEGMAIEEQLVWAQLAPLALAERTLIPATADRFRLLCESRALLQRMHQTLMKEGLTYVAVTVDGAGQERQLLKAHPLVSQHKSMLQRVEAGMKDFKLAPTGKPLAARGKDKPKNALESLQNQLRAIK